MHNASHTLSRSVTSFPFRFRLSPGSLRNVIVLGFEIRIRDTNTYDDDNDMGKKQKEVRVDTINLAGTAWILDASSPTYPPFTARRKTVGRTTASPSGAVHVNYTRITRWPVEKQDCCQRIVPPFQIEHEGVESSIREGARIPRTEILKMLTTLKGDEHTMKNDDKEGRGI